ncbi:hypothetical protein L596_004312 [Steinernema carpocapsae]|uniref:Thioredoxin domain-containing protein n=1 Tax=Steinernema carpocapsae TaxID=34508 RepID=A0A4U8UZI8_STECR|nr:hypothetical protein L596_004312 [Steinernema carpocapsae]
MLLLKKSHIPTRFFARYYASFLDNVQLAVRDGGSAKVDFKKPTVLYFSAGWCRSCRMFTPKLKRFYENVDGDLNIVWISRDKTGEDQVEYYEKSLGPWPYVPFGNAEINDYLQKYEVATIPRALLINAKGEVVDDAIRSKIEESSSPADAKKVLEEWKKLQ